MVTTMSLWWGPVSVCPGEVELCHLTALTSSFEIDYTSSHSYQVLHQFTLLPRAIKVFLHVLSQHFLSRAFLITTLAQVRWNVKEVLLAFLYLESQICAAHRETVLLISFIFSSFYFLRQGLCSFDFPETLYRGQTGLELKVFLLPYFQVPELKVSATMPGSAMLTTVDSS